MDYTQQLTFPPNNPNTLTHRPPLKPHVRSVTVHFKITKIWKYTSRINTWTVQLPSSRNLAFGLAKPTQDAPVAKNMVILRKPSPAQWPRRLLHSTVPWRVNLEMLEIQCSKCHDQYVCETGNYIRIRANQHRSDISIGQKHIPTVRHFRTCGAGYLKLTVLEKVRSHNVEMRRARETFWIKRLKPAINNLT